MSNMIAFSFRAPVPRVPPAHRAGCVLLLLFSCVGVLEGQIRDTGDLIGRVSAGDEPLANVEVYLTGTPHRTLTDGDGAFRIRAVPAGSYSVSVSHIGFEPHRTQVTIPAHGVASLAVDLRRRVHPLADLVVTAQFEPTEARNSVYRVNVVARETMDRRGATDLGALLLQELNARVLHDNVLGRSLILQGMSGQNAKILLDGVPLVSGDANQFDLGQLNLSQVERVEIVEGPLSVQYGTNALAGTINLITRKPGEGRPRLRLSGHAESVGQYNLDGSLGGTVAGIRVLATGGHNRFNGYSSIEAERTKNWNPKTQHFGGVRLARPLGGLTLMLAHDEQWERAVGLGVPIRTPSYTIATDRHYVTRRSLSNLFLGGGLGADRHLELVAGFQRHDRDNVRYLVNLADNSKRRTDEANDHARTLFSTWILRGTYSRGGLAADRLALRVGYDLNVHDSEGERVARERSSITDAGIFLSVSLRPGSGFELQPGVRYLYNNLYDAREVDFLGAGLPVASNLNLRYTAGESTLLRASWARGYRAPSLRELYYFFHDANHSIDGNPHLVPETAHTLSLSARHTARLGGWRIVLEPSVFDNRVRNRIYLLNKLELRPEDENKVARTYFNVPHFRTSGLDLSLAFERGDRFQLRPQAGVLARSGTRSQGARFYSFEAGAELAWHGLPGGTQADVFYKYNGPMAEFSLLEGRLVDRTLHGYHLLDASLTRVFPSRSLTVTTGVKNLFDVTDVLQTGAGTEGLLMRGGTRQHLSVAWGRTAFLRLSWTP